jgi:hypothetical protein
MPNLQKVGLLTPAVQPRYEELGLMQFAALPNDGDIDWAVLSEPLPSQSIAAPLYSGIWPSKEQTRAVASGDD